MTAQKPKTVDEYIAQAPSAAHDKLCELRLCLQKLAPKALEVLKWGQPAFVAEYILFVYAGFKNHVSLHPTPQVIAAFKGELKEYKISDNTVQFSLQEQLPLELIGRMAALRVEQCGQGVTWK